MYWAPYLEWVDVRVLQPKKSLVAQHIYIDEQGQWRNIHTRNKTGRPKRLKSPKWVQHEGHILNGDKMEKEKTDHHQNPHCHTAALTLSRSGYRIAGDQSKLSDFLHETGSNVGNTLWEQGQERSTRNQTQGSADWHAGQTVCCTPGASTSIQCLHI